MYPLKALAEFVLNFSSDLLLFYSVICILGRKKKSFHTAPVYKSQFIVFYQGKMLVLRQCLKLTGYR